jgi:hypothetical protein
MCIYAVPMLALYLIGIGVAWWVHPARKSKRRPKPRKSAAALMRAPSFCLGAAHFCLARVGEHNLNPGPTRSLNGIALAGIPSRLLPLALLAPLPSQHFNGAKLYEYAREFVAIGPRWPTGPGHVKAEEFLRDHFKHDQLEEDTFTANTPIGPVPMRNFIVRFPGKKPGVIVLATHYETNYPLRNINFVGANDGARPPAC